MRIYFLDGLRGVAILLVICFHAYARWPKNLPYSDHFADFPIFKYGYLGVQLFFLISGFVILMSLEKSKKFSKFIYKRWLRLFPSMLIATFLIYMTANFFYERPAGLPKLISVLPGLFFIEPSWIKIITGINIELLEGAFWSLFVEFKFYVIFGLLYFFTGKKKAIVGIFSMFLLSMIAGKLRINELIYFSDLFSFEFFCWFASGALSYLYFIEKKKIYIMLSVIVCSLEIFKYRNDFHEIIFLVILSGTFFLPVYFEKIRFLFKNSLVQFFGLVSYPLYLIHENAMVSMICKINKNSDTIPHILLPIIPMIILSVISYFIVKIVEPFVTRNILKVTDFINLRLEQLVPVRFNKFRFNR